MAKGSELREAMMAALTAMVRKVAAMPYASHGLSGPEKMRAAKESP
jgi:hypothetical protein